MSTIVNRLREIADKCKRHRHQPPTSYEDGEELCRIAAELEAAPAADAAMPAYGTIPWDALVAAVGEAKGSAFEVDPTYYVGHQTCGINMNSLNRIVSKFVAALQAQIASLRAQTKHAEDVVEAAKDRIDELTAELEARQVPDGWVAVPREPTPEMIEEGRRAHWSKEMDQMSPTPTEFYDECGGPIGYAWIAMLAAAPSNPTTQPPVYMADTRITAQTLRQERGLDEAQHG